jgi:hypothetical protein
MIFLKIKKDAEGNKTYMYKIGYSKKCKPCVE